MPFIAPTPPQTAIPDQKALFKGWTATCRCSRTLLIRPAHLLAAGSVFEGDHIFASLVTTPSCVVTAVPDAQQDLLEHEEALMLGPVFGIMNMIPSGSFHDYRRKRGRSHVWRRNPSTDSSSTLLLALCPSP